MKAGRASRAVGVVAGALLAATVVAGWRLPPTEEQAGYARLIAIHPPVAWVAYLSFGVMALASIVYLKTRDRRWDQVAASSAEIGVLFTSLMLITGSIWGRPTWGVWWVWDARLTLSALMLALLCGYVALRRVSVDSDRRALLSAWAAIAAVLVVPINHFAVTWWRTLHQGRSLADIDPSSHLDFAYIKVMLLGFAAMTLTYIYLMIERYRLERAMSGRDDAALAQAIEERRAEGREVAV